MVMMMMVIVVVVVMVRDYLGCVLSIFHSATQRNYTFLLLITTHFDRG